MGTSESVRLGIQGDQALASLSVHDGRSLERVLRGVVTKAKAGSPHPVLVSFATHGPRRSLTRGAPQALLCAALEALDDATTRRAAYVVISLVYATDRVCLSVHDDGAALVHRAHDDLARSGMRSARQAVERVGGSLRRRDREPRGVSVEAGVPLC